MFAPQISLQSIDKVIVSLKDKTQPIFKSKMQDQPGLSIMMVTGPSLINATSIMAPK